MMARYALAFALAAAAACSSSSSDGENGDGPDAAVGMTLADADLPPDGSAADAGAALCEPSGPANPDGLHPIKVIDAADTPRPDAGWKVALPEDLDDAPVSVTSPRTGESAHIFDATGDDARVAGFLASRPSAKATAVAEANDAIAAIRADPTVERVTARVSGNAGTSLDGDPTVIGTVLVVRTFTRGDAAKVRDRLVPALLGRPTAEVDVPDPGWQGPDAREFVITLQTVRRDDGGQAVFMGAVAQRSDYDDRTRRTPIVAGDLSNGTGLTLSGNGTRIACEQFRLDEVPTADIVWVIDESASMTDDRDRVAENAEAFFDKAKGSGLDFRMGVTDMNDSGPGGEPGIFATRAEDGTGDRWITADEAEAFADAIRDPSGPNGGDRDDEHGLTQGSSALSRHLPRDGGDPQMVRPGAKLVVIYASDERPDELEDDGILSDGGGDGNPPGADEAAAIEELLAPYRDELAAEDADSHLIAEPLPYGSEICSDQGAEKAAGYYELVQENGGQIGSICQEDLGPTLDAIIDDVVAAASPLDLSKVPISASIGVARDGARVTRSRAQGWAFRASANTIVFFDMPVDPDRAEDVVIAYRRWADQVVIE